MPRRVAPATAKKPVASATNPVNPAASVSASATNPVVPVKRRRDSARNDSTDAYQERRQEIAKAAAKVFNRNGYQATTISAVAKELGTDRASLYYYMSSKEELFDEVVREVSEHNVATAEAIRNSNRPAPEKLRVLIEALMLSYATHYPILYVYIRENLSHVAGRRSAWSRHMQRVNRRYEDAIIAIVQEGIDAKTIRPVASARVIAYGVVGMIGWTNRWFDPNRSPENAEEIGTGFAEIILEGLRNP